MPRNTFLVLGIGLLLILGLPLSIGASDISLARQGVTLTSLDSPGNVGQFTAVAIGTDGLGLISYHDVANRTLKVAHCSDKACTSATLTTLDNAGEVGHDTSVTIGADGLGLISYYDATNGTLKVAHYSNFARVPTAAQPLSITGSLHSKQRTDRLSVNKKKNGTTAERERAQNRSF